LFPKDELTHTYNKNLWARLNTSQNKKADELKNLYNTYIAMHICIHQIGMESNPILIF